jgi:hexosaminidase
MSTAKPTQPAASKMEVLIPLPVSIEPAAGHYSLTSATGIFVDPATPELTAIGQYLADKLKPATGYNLPVTAAGQGAPTAGSILLTTTGGDPSQGEEGYTLTVTTSGMTLAAYKPAGLFRGLQTIRQILPAAIELPALQAGPWTIPAGVICDQPRFAWRGAMLDVARHFFGVKDVETYIDLLAFYKLNVFHIHLTDDQGWRLEIKSWPDLAKIGGSTAINGDPGGYYTQEQYQEIVAFAAARYITVVPEIDLPGHTTAALASYAELNCDGKAPALYTGGEVGFSSLCVGKDVTYKFLDDVIGELAALTPGPYIHIGGDEAKSTQEADYILFIQKVQDIVQAHGKQMVGWEEISKTSLLPTSAAQAWASDLVTKAASQGAKVIYSPGSKTYLDMQYDASTPLGLHWAGYVSVSDSYQWDPTTILHGIPETQMLGIEMPLWSETLRTIKDIEYMAFPRLPGLAELAWSPLAGRSWDEYRLRLAAQGERLAAMSVNYYHTPEVDF